MKTNGEVGSRCIETKVVKEKVKWRSEGFDEDE